MIFFSLRAYTTENCVQGSKKITIAFFSRCADGYMGQRCEFKDLDGSYLRKYFKNSILVVPA